MKKKPPKITIRLTEDEVKQIIYEEMIKRFPNQGGAFFATPVIQCDWSFQEVEYGGFEIVMYENDPEVSNETE